MKLIQKLYYLYTAENHYAHDYHKILKKVKGTGKKG